MPYSKKVIDNFRDPKNYGKLKKADGVGRVGNVFCGDLMWLYLKVENETIKDIKFETFGCVAAIASSEAITELAKEKSISEALKLTKREVVDELGELPPIKLHCSVLAIDALQEAIYDYLKKNKKKIPKELKKKHQLLEKQRKMIEEKYKDWINKEEQAHEKGD